MKKEVRIPFEDVQDPQLITDYNIRMFKEQGMDIKGNECDIEDDPDMKKRIMKLQPSRKYFYRR